MLELLHDELAAVGLQMHEAKTKILTSSENCGRASLPVRGMSIEILERSQAHRYLGKMLSLDPESRVKAELDNRLRAAWCKFNQLRRWLTNRNIHLRSRLRLFDSAVRPTALFGLLALPLSVSNLRRISGAEMRIRRCIVGWVRVGDEDWHSTMTRMKSKLEQADRIFHTIPWLDALQSQQFKFLAHLQRSPCSWPRNLARWSPHGLRPQGRPHLRWDDHANQSLRTKAGCNHWLNAPRATLLALAARPSGDA